MNPNAEKVSRAAIIALAEPGMKQAVQSVAGEGDPARAIATIAMNIIDALDEKSGGKIPQDAVPEAAEQIVTMLVELVESVGGKVDEATVGRVLQSLLEQTVLQAEAAGEGGQWQG